MGRGTIGQSRMTIVGWPTGDRGRPIWQPGIEGADGTRRSQPGGGISPGQRSDGGDLFSSSPTHGCTLSLTGQGS
jgi:hypothetical protein